MGLLAAVALLALTALVVSVVTARTRRRRSSRSAATTARGLDVVLDERGIVRRTAAGDLVLAPRDAPFGVTMLAACGRDTAVLAFTTPAQTRYVAMRTDGRSPEDDALFARHAILADLDLVDGVHEELALPTSHAASLLRRIDARSPGALGRVFLTSTKGMPIELDAGALRVGERRFDLAAALAWRSLIFHESTGQATVLYQAIAIVQGDTAVTLVAPMPAAIVPHGEAARARTDAAASRLDEAIARHLRLVQAPNEPPPPRDLRVAIDRPFMMAVRRALDEAPLAEASVLKARASWDASTSPPRSTT